MQNILLCKSNHWNLANMKNEPNNTHVPYTAIKTESKTSRSLLVSPGVATLAKQRKAKQSKAK